MNTTIKSRCQLCGERKDFDRATKPLHRICYACIEHSEARNAEIENAERLAKIEGAGIPDNDDSRTWVVCRKRRANAYPRDSYWTYNLHTLKTQAAAGDENAALLLCRIVHTARPTQNADATRA